MSNEEHEKLTEALRDDLDRAEKERDALRAQVARMESALREVVSHRSEDNMVGFVCWVGEGTFIKCENSLSTSPPTSAMDGITAATDKAGLYDVDAGTTVPRDVAQKIAEEIMWIKRTIGAATGIEVPDDFITEFGCAEINEHLDAAISIAREHGLLGNGEPTTPACSRCGNPAEWKQVYPKPDGPPLCHGVEGGRVSDAKINAAVAEAHGWTTMVNADGDLTESHLTRTWVEWISPSGEQAEQPPSFCTDLNAIQEVFVAQDESFRSGLSDYMIDFAHSKNLYVWELSARDWCEIFLRRKRLWKEGA